MTPQEALQVFGQDINAQYFDGTSYTDCVFQYDSVQSITSIDSESSYQFGVGSQFLRYYCFLSPGTVQQNPAYITFDISPTYSIMNTSQIHTFIALSSRLSISNAYQSPSWDWSVGGSTVHLENNDCISFGSTTRARLFADGVSNASFVPFDFSSASTTSGYSFRATFSGNYGMTDNSNRYALCIGLPYISSDASGATGTLPPESSGTDINVNVNVDMSETNEKLDEQTGILQSIKQGIQGIFDTIKNALVSVFVPDSDFMDDFKDDMQDLLSDHLGGLYQAISAIDDIFDRFVEARAKGSIHIDAVQIPLAGETLTLGNWDVPLKQDGLSLLYDGIAFIIDFLAVAAFLNMCRNKLEIFLNPDSEVIQD